MGGVDDDELVLMPDKVIRCRFNLNHEVFPSGFYDVCCFRADDRGKLVEITRERFQLRNHSIGRRTGSVSRTIQGWLPKSCRSASTRSSRGGWLPRRWPAGTRSVPGER